MFNLSYRQYTSPLWPYSPDCTIFEFLWPEFITWEIPENAHLFSPISKQANLRGNLHTLRQLGKLWSSFSYLQSLSTSSFVEDAIIAVSSGFYQGDPGCMSCILLIGLLIYHTRQIARLRQEATGQGCRVKEASMNRVNGILQPQVMEGRIEGLTRSV